jgi:hypothetical protein
MADGSGAPAASGTLTQEEVLKTFESMVGQRQQFVQKISELEAEFAE